MDAAKAQEDFALASAKAHARTSLFVTGSGPFEIQATVSSFLALHGVGKGTYDNRWVDAEHWERRIRFPDFEQNEMRNDAGHAWTDQTADAIPLRVAEMLRVVVLHVPGSNSASRVPVSETSMRNEQGEALTCYSARSPKELDGFALNYRWCFSNASGLLVSQDLPMKTHISYNGYVAFQGKQEFTRVHVTAGGLPVLDLDIRYNSLDPHALDSRMPGAFMHRSASAGTPPNPEELRKGTVEYRYNPVVPAGTPDSAKGAPVLMHFHVGPDDTLLDACVEDAPTEAMAAAALQGALRFTFTPLLVDGKATSHHVFQDVWFRSGGEDAAQSGTVAQREAKTDGTAGEGSAGTGFGGVYRNHDPSFAFAFPAGFERIPQGEIEDDLRRGLMPHHTSNPGENCTNVLFRAQRLRQESKRADFLAVYDLSPNCIFGVLDRQALRTIAARVADGLATRWMDRHAAEPRWYVMQGRRVLAVTSVVGRTPQDEAMQLLVVTTSLNGHVVITTLGGPPDHLAQVLRESTLQVGDDAAFAVLPEDVAP